MDLSKLKWPIIIGVIILIGILISEPGLNYAFNKLCEYSPGTDPEQDKKNEANLSSLGGFMLKTFRYGKAQSVFQEAINRYPEGTWVLYNQYRLAKCAEKLNDPAEAVRLLRELEQMDAHAVDPRIPEAANLKLRADKLMEMHGLGEVQGY